MCYNAVHAYGSRANASVFMLLAATIGYSGVGYVRNYRPDIAYEAHFGGFGGGFLIYSVCGKAAGRSLLLGLLLCRLMMARRQ